ncbi:MMPL family transporter [Nocardia sp. NBC_00511]|uniref:MMPL family transporter n=1 Tax=Nocardia sp. NBC_00511 TaxID=2903591 RepID=UPI0030E197DA
MSTLLYRLGMLAFRRPWWFIGGWAVLVAVIAGLLIAAPPTLSTQIRIDGTPAQQAIDTLAAELPQASGGQGSLVFTAPRGDRVDTPPVAAAIGAAVDAVLTSPHVIDPRALATVDTAAPHALIANGHPVPGGLVSPDGRVALLQFQFDVQTFELPSGTVDHVLAAARAPLRTTAIEVLPGSTLVTVPEIFGPGEIAGVGIAAVVLIITLGSLIAAGLPLATALIGVAVGVGGAFILSNLFEMPSISLMLALMLGLAVGIDYSLFIVNRQRRLIIDHYLPADEAAARAVGTAGSAVFFAGATVVIALSAMLVVGISMLTKMALIGAGTVAVAVAVALTALPALLGVIGERICSLKARSDRPADPDGRRGPIATGYANLLVRNRLAVIAAIIGAGVLLAWPISDMQLGLPSGASYNTGTEQRRSYDAVAQGFGAGYNGPLLIVAESARATTPLSPHALTALTAELATLPDVAAAAPAGMSKDGSTAVLSIVPGSGPNDRATRQLVDDIRSRAAELTDRYGITVGVTGFTALGIDVSDRLFEVMPLYLIVVVGLSLIILLAVFRSLVVPIKAALGFLLSVLGTFGATTAVFQWGWLDAVIGLDATAPVICILPILVTGVLFGLAMDYEVFLVSSIRDKHVHGGGDTVVRGYADAARIVVAAAVIMISVFTGFVFNTDPMVKQLGFTLAAGVAIDAFLVRLTLVPAVLALFGDRAWALPSWLDRILPDLDVEGSRLLNR